MNVHVLGYIYIIILHYKYWITNFRNLVISQTHLDRNVSFCKLMIVFIEEFYLGPLNSIDDLIDKKLIEIDAKVQWKQKFKVVYWLLYEDLLTIKFYLLWCIFKSTKTVLIKFCIGHHCTVSYCFRKLYNPNLTSENWIGQTLSYHAR